MNSAIDADLTAITNDLRRIFALQTEFGAFVSLATVRVRGGTGGGGRSGCWRVLKERLSGLERHFHGAQVPLCPPYPPPHFPADVSFVIDGNAKSVFYLVFTLFVCIPLNFSSPSLLPLLEHVHPFDRALQAKQAEQC